MASSSQRACDATKDECGHGAACVDGACQRRDGSVPVGAPCVADRDCSSWRCAALPSAAARDAGLPHAPRVCVADAFRKTLVTDFATR